MTTFVAVHGAWSAGWAWHRFHPLMAKWGHRLLTPTCTGLGERGHLISPWVGLSTHIEDVCRVLEFEDLRDIVLVGHSYGGMVVTGVLDKMPERIRHLVYLDALLPESGEAALDVLPAEHGRAIDKLVETQGYGWLIPPPPCRPTRRHGMSNWPERAGCLNRSGPFENLCSCGRRTAQSREPMSTVERPMSSTALHDRRKGLKKTRRSPISKWMLRTTLTSRSRWNWRGYWMTLPTPGACLKRPDASGTPTKESTWNSSTAP